jgi:hypothetical protein
MVASQAGNRPEKTVQVREERLITIMRTLEFRGNRILGVDSIVKEQRKKISSCGLNLRGNHACIASNTADNHPTFIG